MAVFAHRFLSSADSENDLPPTPGRYKRSIGMRVDGLGRPIVAATGAAGGLTHPTRADRDRPDPRVWGTVTKAERDRDHWDERLRTSAPWLTVTKTSAGRDSDRETGTRRRCDPPLVRRAG